MTISTQQSQVILLGNGATTAFTFPFVGVAPADISVIYTDPTGNVTTLNTSQYTLVLNAAPAGELWGIGGTVTYPTAAPAIANGSSLTILRTLPLTQETSITDQDNFYPEVVEQGMDVLEMQIQQISSRTGQFRGTWATGINFNFGDYVIDGANGANTGDYYMCVLANVSGVWGTDLSNGDWVVVINVASINASVAAAAGSATAAAASTVAAAISADTSTTQADIATTQASAAATSATNSAASATTATTEAGIATTEAGIATTQANNASTSATSASGSESSANTSAGQAATFATNASNSAAAAAASAAASAGSFQSTSTTSLAVGTGSKTLTVGTGLNFATGAFLMISETSSATNYMHGTVTSYNSSTGSLTVNVTDISGSGTYIDWTVSVSGTQGPAGVSGGYFPGGITAGTADAQTITISSLVLADGIAISFRPNINVNGSASLNVNSGGAIQMVAPNFNNISTGMLLVGAEYVAVYQQLGNVWVILNPSVIWVQSVANSSIINPPAYTIKGNNTASSNVTIQDLTSQQVGQMVQGYTGNTLQNMLRNGSMLIDGRGPGNGTISSGTQGYTLDQFIIAAQAGNITWSQGSGFGAPGLNGQMQNYLSVTGNSGNTGWQLIMRIGGEMAGQATNLPLGFFIGGIFNSSGGTITPTIKIDYANSLNNFGAVTNILATTNMSTMVNGFFDSIGYVAAALGSNSANGIQITVNFGALPSGFYSMSGLGAYILPGVASGIQNNIPYIPYPPKEVEQLRCNAYLPSFGETTGVIGAGNATSTTAAGFFIPFDTETFTAPTGLTVTTLGDFEIVDGTGSNVAALTGMAFNNASRHGAFVTTTVASGLTSGAHYYLKANTALAGNLIFTGIEL